MKGGCYLRGCKKKNDTTETCKECYNTACKSVLVKQRSSHRAVTALDRSLDMLAQEGPGVRHEAIFKVPGSN
ncbi:hypothetical protein TNIN_332991 [Trichonephila inaurata madagascariensis]|uniref:Uncharacterized protein n=1 Tax=Trichonephila inaurata madagascariensis TaxID=2747483 RepID=A0A8X6K3K0_9ARAC|nr:hypothetical protein TNIN_332991 [Trichonephila inaurata madagascariensis]